MQTTPSLPLVTDDRFAEITNLIGGHKVWYIKGPGNPGDKLIHAGADCLFRRINTRAVSERERPDFVLWCGGGNLGTLWPSCHTKRQERMRQASEMGIPFVIMPQSATNAEESFPDDVRIFLREKFSQVIYPRSTLAPDLSLAFDDDVSAYVNAAPRLAAGVFLRMDKEAAGQFDQGLSLGDSARIARNYHDYFRLASLFELIVTDRLHFAVTALILGRKTVLLPNSYHKNQGLYDAWLADLGCHWGKEAMMEILGRIGYAPERVRAEFQPYGRSFERKRDRFSVIKTGRFSPFRLFRLAWGKG